MTHQKSARSALSIEQEIRLQYGALLRTVRRQGDRIQLIFSDDQGVRRLSLLFLVWEWENVRRGLPHDRVARELETFDEDWDDMALPAS